MQRTIKKYNRAEDQSYSNPIARRQFLQVAGAAAVVLMGGCDNDDDRIVNGMDDAVDLGEGDVGILNYAYALEQLEAAFYTRVVSSPFTGISNEEMRILTDLRNHEIVHREFFARALGNDAIPALDVDFSTIDFDSRNSVLSTARTFEDLGVAAYNGAGRLLSSSEFLTVAGKIVSVEARHAAVIRDLLQPMSAFFAGDDVIDANGLDRAMTPAEVLMQAAPFIITEISADNLPTS